MFNISAVIPNLILLATFVTSIVLGTEPSKPNIVFILADDLGYGDPTCYNAESKTPTAHIDRLAREGMRFTDAHAPGSVCIPTRYGLMTGRYPFRRNLKTRVKIEAGRPTIASLLRRNGYRTAMVGKWHLGFDIGPGHDWSQPLQGGPLDCGFDSYFGIPASLDIQPYYYIRDRYPVAAPTERIEASNTEGWTRVQGAFWRAGGIAPGFKHEEVLPRLGEEAVKIIDQRGRNKSEVPLFLYVAFTAPHTPWLPQGEFRGKSGADIYGDFVMQVDRTAGSILDALDRNHMTENTLVIFTSDNGPVWYPQDAEAFGHRAAGPLRGMKGDAWEGGHRMPFLARWPGRIPSSSTCDATICFTDMMATFAAIVGDKLPPNAGEDSCNALPLLEGKVRDAPIRDVTIHKRSATAIRQGKWKLITHLGSGGMSLRKQETTQKGEPTGQLYDLEADLGETTNLWFDRPDVVRRLTRLLQECKNAEQSNALERMP
jgi:arylsulfatase A